MAAWMIFASLVFLVNGIRCPGLRGWMLKLSLGAAILAYLTV